MIRPSLSPSPRPSPQRRGRIVSSFNAKLRLTSAQSSLEHLRAGNGCPLSPGERVRVRGSGTLSCHLRQSIFLAA